MNYMTSNSTEFIFLGRLPNRAILAWGNLQSTDMVNLNADRYSNKIRSEEIFWNICLPKKPNPSKVNCQIKLLNTKLVGSLYLGHFFLLKSWLSAIFNLGIYTLSIDAIRCLTFIFYFWEMTQTLMDILNGLISSLNSRNSNSQAPFD